MRKRTGFTIIELLIVVIIIGVLATIAVPQFTKAIEKAKMSKAQNMIGIITKAQAMIYAETDNYSNDLTGATGLKNYIAEIRSNDGSWTYTTITGTAALTVGATRSGGKYNSCTLTYTASTGQMVSAGCVKTGVLN